MKPTVIDPKTTTRAAAFDLWMSAPNPMVTFFKTLDVIRADTRQTFAAYCDYVINLKENRGTKHSTIVRYK